MSGKNSPKRAGTVLMTVGLLLVAAALFLTVYNLWDERRAADTVAQTLEEIVPLLETAAAEESDPGTIPDFQLAPGMERPSVQAGGRDYIGIVDIPVLGLSLPVLSQWSDPNLRIAPCRYRGDAYEDPLIIAGHNYRSHFGLLKELIPGDTVRFIDADGNVFSYTVERMEVLGRYDVEEMETGEWDLTLFTCTIDGKTRVTVRCKACAA